MSEKRLKNYRAAVTSLCLCLIVVMMLVTAQPIVFAEEYASVAIVAVTLLFMALLPLGDTVNVESGYIIWKFLRILTYIPYDDIESAKVLADTEQMASPLITNLSIWPENRLALKLKKPCWYLTSIVPRRSTETVIINAPWSLQ